MLCPKCGQRSRCYDSRPVENGLSVTRLRECKGCGYRFRTRETIIGGQVDAEMEALAER